MQTTARMASVVSATPPARRRLIRSIGLMKRVFTYNGIVAISFVLLWMLLAAVEVRIHLYEFLGPIFFISLPLAFAGFVFASWRALRPTKEDPFVIAFWLSLVVTPVFIIVGVILVTNFKFMIGGHL